ncbi:MAG: YceI family protein [Spirochaetales bacterium]
MNGKAALKVLLVIFVVLFVGALGFLGYIWFSGGSGEASRVVEAEAVEPVRTESFVYDVDLDQSEARFVIEEVLRGQPNTVVGVTNQIDGSFIVDLDPAQVEIGEFVINVRTIATDDEVRDRTIRTLILESNRDEFEFASFRPTRIEGLPETIAFGDTLRLDVTGDLTVRDVTTETTFDMVLTLVSDERIEGDASSNITWEELDIIIPYVGGNSIVASVAENLDLELEFVASGRPAETASE